VQCIPGGGRCSAKIFSGCLFGSSARGGLHERAKTEVAATLSHLDFGLCQP